MTADKLAARLVAFRPALTDVLGFHDLIDGGFAKTPLDAMRHRVHCTAASVKLAQDVLQITGELLEDGE